ncbi:MAG: hypothetical protein ACR2NN_01030, partial [Bryobacteraceae bacterium]
MVRIRGAFPAALDRDAQRLADRWCSGDLEESFIPSAEQRSWRWLTRTRVDLKCKVTTVRNQVEGLLEQGGIKLPSVASDVFGVSGWAMLERIADPGEARAGGETDTARAQAHHCESDYCGSRSAKLIKNWARLRLRTCRMKEHAACLYRLCQIPGVQVDVRLRIPGDGTGVIG